MLSTMRQLSVEKQRQNISEMETEASANHHLHHHHHLHSGQAIIIVILVIFMKEFALKVFIVFIYCERESRTAKMDPRDRHRSAGIWDFPCQKDHPHR